MFQLGHKRLNFKKPLKKDLKNYICKKLTTQNHVIIYTNL